MPVCVRDIGIFFGLVIGSLLFYLKGFNRWTQKIRCYPYSQINIHKDLSAKQAWQSVLLLSFFSIIPLVFDGFLQLLTSYESTSTMRLVTGLPLVSLSDCICVPHSQRPNAFTGDAVLCGCLVGQDLHNPLLKTSDFEGWRTPP